LVPQDMQADPHLLQKTMGHASITVIAAVRGPRAWQRGMTGYWTPARSPSASRTLDTLDVEAFHDHARGLSDDVTGSQCGSELTFAPFMDECDCGVIGEHRTNGFRFRPECLGAEAEEAQRRTGIPRPSRRGRVDGDSYTSAGFRSSTVNWFGHGPRRPFVPRTVHVDRCGGDGSEGFEPLDHVGRDENSHNWTVRRHDQGKRCVSLPLTPTGFVSSGRKVSR